MWNKNQLAIFQRALAAAQKWQQSLDRLSEIAKHSPQFADRINELIIRANNVQNLAEAALTLSSTAADK